MTLNPRAAHWLEARAIDSEIIARMGIYSGRREQAGDDQPATVVPDAVGDILVFPYFEGDQEVNSKYRAKPRADGSKVLWQRPGGKKTFYNADILDDPSLSEGSNALVIVEGEPDCLSVLTAGYPFCVSVPDGAPPDKDAAGKALPPVPESGDDIDPERDDKYGYIFNNWERLSRVKRIVIFTDGDGPGQRLRDELVRRLGRVRCSFVTYPPLDDKKPDANEVLIKYGSAAIITMIANASPFPVRGIYHLADFPQTQRPVIYSTGWGRLDIPASPGQCALMLATGFFMVVLGKPGSGKSTWTLQLIYNLANAHHWNVGVASFEVQPVPYVRDILRTHIIGKGMHDWGRDDREMADEWINKKFTFFHIDARQDESDQSLEWLLDKAADAVVRDGIKVLLVDPWNEIEHVRRSNETETQYTNRAIRALKKFAMAYDVLVIVVVHPTKSGGDKQQKDISLYDADGSAAWVNKPDIGVVIERDDDNNRCVVHGRKFRFSFLGRKGATDFIFDPRTETYSQ